jgi:hypothetical protein
MENIEDMTADEIYDGQLGEAVKELLGKKETKELDKNVISECYWHMGHDIADDRYGFATLPALTLVGALNPESERNKAYFERQYPGQKDMHELLGKIGTYAKKFIAAVEKQEGE